MCVGKPHRNYIHPQQPEVIHFPCFSLTEILMDASVAGWSNFILKKDYMYDFFRLRNELDRNQFLLGNDNEWT